MPPHGHSVPLGCGLRCHCVCHFAFKAGHDGRWKTLPRGRSAVCTEAWGRAVSPAEPPSWRACAWLLSGAPGAGAGPAPFPGQVGSGHRRVRPEGASAGRAGALGVPGASCPPPACPELRHSPSAHSEHRPRPRRGLLKCWRGVGMQSQDVASPRWPVPGCAVSLQPLSIAKGFLPCRTPGALALSPDSLPDGGHSALGTAVCRQPLPAACYLLSGRRDISELLASWTRSGGSWLAFKKPSAWLAELPAAEFQLGCEVWADAAGTGTLRTQPESLNAACPCVGVRRPSVTHRC